MVQPIALYTHGPTPNPVKVAIVLEELGLPWEAKHIEFPTENKSEPYISVNPNGRVPSIEDPNTGVNLFESGAIIEYLIDTYDKEHKLSYTTSPEKYLTQAWLHFQVSGQGPYFGQLSWFMNFHPEVCINHSADRYRNEIKRVTKVVDAHLKKHGKGALVGGKVTYADLAFLPWFRLVPFLMGDWDFKSECPNFAEWFQSLLDREAVKKTLAMDEFQMKR
ncbi:glutathione S-transferase [Rhizodiscina lignyota]|uniref:Glutathione S-transferase n=1 Tax=Rhizodiscina lignyota TaxID=1504668 RepID=A0A9P4IKL8_9PEZI|nr:glutathione S-transferase [Rhizodiscina lignyota]